MLGSEILELLYAPHKAFKKIAEKPRFLGAMLIIVLFVVVTLGYRYVEASKFSNEVTFPSSSDYYNPDQWTDNFTLWASNGNVASTNHDVLFGYNSIQFNATNEVEIWMEQLNFGSLDVTGSNGYENFTLAIKWIQVSATPPQNVSLYLFSTTTDDYFYRDLTSSVRQIENGTWEKLTFPVGTGAQGWSSNSSQATWTNITGMKLDLTWPETARSNLIVLLDRVFFQSNRFEALVNSMYIKAPYFAFDAVIGFSFCWMVFGFALFLGGRAFGAKADLKTFLIIMGYAMVVFVIMKLIFMILFLAIPQLYTYIDTTTPISDLQNVLTIEYYVILLLPIWSLMLALIGVRTILNVPVGKSFSIAVIGLLPYYILFFVAPSFIFPLVV